MLKDGYFWQPVSISYSHSNWWQLKIILVQYQLKIWLHLAHEQHAQIKFKIPLFCYFIRAHSSSLVCCHLKAIEKPLTGRTVKAAVQQHTSVLEECGCKCTPIKSFYSWRCGIRSGVNQLCYNSTCSSHGSRRTEVYRNSSSRVRVTWKPLKDTGTEPTLNNVF